MKVLVVSYLLDPQIGGGAATSASRLCQGLAQQGIEVIALATHNDAAPRVVTEHNIKTYYFRPRNLYWIAEKSGQPSWKKAIWQLIDTWNPHAYRFAREVIGQEKPDVVHAHKLRGLSPSVWAAAKAENSRLLVQTCRDYELISPEGTLESNIGRMALKRHWALRPYQALRSRWSRQVDVVTAPSRFTLDTITDLGFFSRSQRRVVPNSHGLTTAELDRMAAKENAPAALDEVSFLFLGRLESTKGIDLLCRAFAGIVDELPRARLDIAGKGPRGAALRAQYAGVPQIRFHGHVTGVEKDNLVARSLILVMPSISREVFGNSIIEAYTWGKPVVAARVGGMPEIIQEGRTGFLIEPDNVESLQDIIRQLYADPSIATGMVKAVHEAARSYTMEAVTSAYLRIFETGLRNEHPAWSSTGPINKPGSKIR